ncbi:uncharacterized protein LOC133315946 isoform X2 [Gastrolobium bilobum]|uniref:uncharacterized protein LOC133315946 isoform X2 n=1 Tax=Gastrolobium bilobum TaxID=150636 RepID=UPI002AB1FB26|nr:uncharacterized protein LOC133315946 isoform X2 [Gastrolobium bilobum]
MALEVEWYDLVCFGIVGVALVGALWVLWMKERASQSNFGILDENLLVAGPDNGMAVNVLIHRAIGHVSTSQLWTSCWRGVHPLWLLATRFLSFVIMAVLLALDVLAYDPSIFLYYTEWTFTLVMIYFALGTIVSAYGCWQFLNKTPFENGEMAEFLRRDLEESMSPNSIAYKGKETKGSIKLKSRYVEEEFKQGAGFWGYLMQIIYQTSAGAVVLTDIVFWCVIVPFLSISHFKLNMLMGCMHTLNAVFLLLDTALNNLTRIFCALELWLHNFPMGHSRLWFYMVAISISRAKYPLGSCLVSLLGGNSHTLLWHLFINSESKKYDSSQTVPSCTLEVVLVWLKT